jgi:hypothetical protein
MSERPSGFVLGWTTFAAFMMLLIGGFHVMAGIIAILNDAFYTATRDYVFEFDTSTWGWIHLILGTIVFLAGGALFSGAVWARAVGVIMAVISAFVGFAWLPWYPVWGVVFISIAVTVIWALTVHGREMAER